MNIILQAIGTVNSTRKELADDNWSVESSYIELNATFEESSLAGLTDFSHVEIIFYMNRVDPSKIETSSRHPRNNQAWPKVGIFSQRGKNRPNQIGTTICELVKVEGRKIYLKNLDAIDGTPVLDIKPWMEEFGPKSKVKQAKWSVELMKGYWS